MPLLNFQKRNRNKCTIQKTDTIPYSQLLRHCIFLFAILLLAGAGQIQAQANPRKSNDLNFIRAYNGEYAFDVKLFNVPRFKTRLQKLLGKQYTYFMKDIWQVETPIKIENDFVYAWAMQAHSGGDPAATLLADLQTNKLYIKIVKDHKTTLYTEDGSKAVPKPLADWATIQSSH